MKTKVFFIAFLTILAFFVACKKEANTPNNKNSELSLISPNNFKIASSLEELNERMKSAVQSKFKKKFDFKIESIKYEENVAKKKSIALVKIRLSDGQETTMAIMNFKQDGINLINKESLETRRADVLIIAWCDGGCDGTACEASSQSNSNGTLIRCQPQACGNCSLSAIILF